MLMDLASYAFRTVDLVVDIYSEFGIDFDCHPSVVVVVVVAVAFGEQYFLVPPLYMNKNRRNRLICRLSICSFAEVSAKVRMNLFWLVVRILVH